MILRVWLKNVIQVVDPYVSSEDIEKGTRWFAEIGRNLEEAKVGIVCLTRENMTKPWVLFESGAISRSIERSRVTPLLIDLGPADLSGPLAQFQATTITKAEMLRLVKSIGTQLNDDRFTPVLIESAFQKWWPDFQSQVTDAVRLAGSVRRQPHVRSDREVLEELLETTRSIAQHATRQREETSVPGFVTGRTVSPRQPVFAEIISGLEKRRRRLLIAALEAASAAEITDETLTITFDAESKHYRDTMAREDNLRVLRDVVAEVLGKQVEIRLSISRKLF